MPSRGLAVVLASLFAASVLAGCSGGTPTAVPSGGRPTVSDDKGAITGVVVDDRYRPVPDATIALTPLGITTTSDTEGQFGFGDLEPGSYVLLVNAKDHEAAPKNVDVKAHQYTEVEAEARRTFSDSGYLITTEYSIFISCAVDYLIDGQDGVEGQDCTLDQSGDSFRPDFTTDYRTHGKNVTYLVAEMITNKNDYYEVQLRAATGKCGYLAIDDIHGMYSRIQLDYGKVNNNQTNTGLGTNNKFDNKCPIQTILFPDEGERTTLQGLPVAGGVFCCGAGLHLGIKAKFVQSLFLGPPTTDIKAYCVLSPKGQCASDHNP